ncbi:MAG TPA: hypoxanthine phosphoribosyltransferase [Chloroflexota bacterium]
MDADMLTVLIGAEELQRRVGELAAELARVYAERNPVLVGVLKGAVVFIVDLMRAMAIPLQVEFMAVSSYQGGTQSSGAVRILMDLKTSVEGRDVVIVEDIVDSGLTLRYLRDYLLSQRPASLCIVALLDKEIERTDGVQLDYTGFRIPDRFVVGYGLDYAERYRNLPYVGVIKPTIPGGEPAGAEGQP